ncbi:hypothetical protein F4825DRAFT_54634 [Nemania diffusa]|nr:hypothetical protein F4825DRAFT_54634 [Nemania diffusa]
MTNVCLLCLFLAEYLFSDLVTLNCLPTVLQVIGSDTCMETWLYMPKKPIQTHFCPLFHSFSNSILSNCNCLPIPASSAQSLELTLGMR